MLKQMGGSITNQMGRGKFSALEWVMECMLLAISLTTLTLLIRCDRILLGKGVDITHFLVKGIHIVGG